MSPYVPSAALASPQRRQEITSGQYGPGPLKLWLSALKALKTLGRLIFLSISKNVQRTRFSVLFCNQSKVDTIYYLLRLAQYPTHICIFCKLHKG